MITQSELESVIGRDTRNAARKFSVMNELTKEICVATSIQRSVLLSYCREPRVARARQLLMLKARQEGLTLEAIGDFLNRDVSTVIYGIRRAKERLN